MRVGVVQAAIGGAIFGLGIVAVGRLINKAKS